MLFDFNLEHFGNCLVCTWEEVISQNDFIDVGQIFLVNDCWVNIEKKRKVQRLIGIQKLIFKTETLDFIEI